MLRALLAFLYDAAPETFPSGWPVEQAVARLRAATAKSVFHTLAREAAAGTVTERKVSLQRAIPFVGNSFKPFFVGRFQVTRGQAQLNGVFTMHWAVKIFMSFWFGLGALWTLLAIGAAVAKPAELWFFPLAGVGILLAGAALVKIGKWLARNDRTYLSRVITDALA